GYLRSSAMPMQDDEKETNAVNRTPYTPFAERCARRHRRTLLTMVAAVLLVTGTVPFLASMAAALPHCPDGSPPPCDLPDPDPGPDDPPPPPPDDPEPPPAPEPECDAPGGFARPVGIVPPGYIYSPTAFGGVVADPQPDDTFAADAAGHAPYVGRLRTRVANGREEFLVCAHAVPAHRNGWARGHDGAASRRHRRGRQHGGVRSRHRRDQRHHLQLRRLDRRARGLRADVGSVHLRHARARVHRSCRDSWHAE